MPHKFVFYRDIFGNLKPNSISPSAYNPFKKNPFAIGAIQSRRWLLLTLRMIQDGEQQ